MPTYPSLHSLVGGGKSRQKWEFVIGMPFRELSPLICPTLLAQTLRRKLVVVALGFKEGDSCSSKRNGKPHKTVGNLHGRKEKFVNEFQMQHADTYVEE